MRQADGHFVIICRICEMQLSGRGNMHLPKHSDKGGLDPRNETLL